MRAFLASCLAAAIIAVCAAVILDRYYQEPANVAYTTTSVRL